MVVEIAGGIILAFFVMGLLEDYPQILYWVFGIAGVLLGVCFWERIWPLVLVFVGLFVFGLFRYLWVLCIKHKKQKK